MSANVGKNTMPEIVFRKSLWGIGLRGYRVHPARLPGRPDIAFPQKKLSIFINGCFWHRCPRCKLPLPKTNKKFWKTKFEKNIIRDKEKIRSLKKDGWKVLTIWECELNKTLSASLRKVQRLLKN